MKAVEFVRRIHEGEPYWTWFESVGEGVTIVRVALSPADREPADEEFVVIGDYYVPDYWDEDATRFMICNWLESEDAIRAAEDVEAGPWRPTVDYPLDPDAERAAMRALKEARMIAPTRRAAIVKARAFLRERGLLMKGLGAVSLLELRRRRLEGIARIYWQAARAGQTTHSWWERGYDGETELRVYVTEFADVARANKVDPDTGARLGSDGKPLPPEEDLWA